VRDDRRKAARRIILSLKLAVRELRSGVAGFRIFLACLALGVAALAAGSTAQAFRQGLASQSRAILGGDVAVSVEGRRFTQGERSAFTRLGPVTDTLRVRAMASGRRAEGDRRLAEVRGVDAAYPLAGSLKLEGAATLEQATAVVAGVAGAAVEPELLDRLHIKLGQRFLLGDTPFIARAAVADEPDRLGRGFALGPGILISKAVLEHSGLISNDALLGETVRIVLPSRVSPATTAADLIGAFPSGGFRARGRNDAAAGLGQLIDQLEFFLSFIGLAALLAGGLGVSSAVTTYLSARKPSIAVLKALGADGALIRNVYLIQISVLAVLGVAIGLAIGAASPFLLGWIAKNRLPVPVLFALYPEPLARAAMFGVLSAAVFSLAPLARARSTPPSSLFRKNLSGRVAFGPELIALVFAAIGLVALTIITAPSAMVAGVMLGGILAAFHVLWLVGQAAVRLGGGLRQFASGPVRIGLANLAGPGSAARTASSSIGFGVALLTTVVMIQSSLLAEVRDVAPNTAPSMIFTQISPETAAAFDADLAAVLGPLSSDRYRRYPFATGRISMLRGVRIDKEKIAHGQRWAFDSDISISALGAAPSDAGVIAGHWWPTNYAGPSLVMLDSDIAHAAALRPGDTITVSLLGRDLDARIAGLRKVEWGKFGASFPIIFDADALKGANLRNIAIAKTTQTQEAAILGRLGRDFPSINVISVREQLDVVAKIFNQLAWAVRGAAAVAALAGLLVLIGAIAATAQARTREAAILKVLGSTRLQILAAYCVEYGAVGAIAGVTGVLLGGVAAYPVITSVFHTHWSIDWSGIVVVLASVAGAATFAGGGGALVSLARRPAPVLRSE
jgi:putative ABC transport system permease protein